ncbi:A24 family peptidase [Candidatus Woesearchaeota archaeon]|nr:A24 family peptidase [Candidatus Woesearchaeota archaeon]
MIIDLVLLSIAFVALFIGSITDIKTREVPDWLNFGLIFAAIGIRALYSVITFDYMFLINGIIGLIVFVIIAYIMFYTGQWGGGDSKMLMGLGAVFGLTLALNPFPKIGIFLINVFIAGAVYGLIYSTALAIKNRKKFVKEFLKFMHNKKIIKYRRIVLILFIILTLLILFLIKDLIFKWILLAFVFVIYISFYLIFFVKAVELSSMFKYIEPSELTEGDWIAKEYKVDDKKICSPKDLGISKKQIRQLIALKRKGKIKTIKIKQGIPFVPSFLAALIITVIWGAWWILLF